MSDGEGAGDLLIGTDRRTGYVKPLGQAWRQVEYADVDGRAIFEGCILLGPTAEMEDSRRTLEQQVQTRPELLSRPNAKAQGAAIKGKQYLWPNRTVSYVIDPSLTDPSRVLAAMAAWESRASIFFRPRTTEVHYVLIRRVLGGCASAVGCRGGQQEMIVSDTSSFGAIVHELGHAIGLWHEQSRADRDRFVEILVDNIDPDALFNFRQSPQEEVDVLDYDFGSIMHYEPTAFSADQVSPTIRPRRPLPPGVVMGQRLAPSPGDIAAVDRIYAGMPKPHG